MRLRHETAQRWGAPPPGQRVWTVAAALAAYAMLAPLAVAALAGPLPLRGFGTLALAASLLGPGLAVILVCWRGLGAIVQDAALAPDEPQQALLRLFATAAALAYVGALALVAGDAAPVQPLVALDVAAALGAWLVALHVVLAPRAAWRPAVALAGDVLLLSLFLHWGGRWAAPWGLAYLALVFDYGLRFGRATLVGAALASAVGFAAVAATTPVWRAMPAADVAICVALSVLPLYGVALVARLRAARGALAAARSSETRLFAVLAHELGAPLDTLGGLAALLGRTRLEPAQRDMAATIELAARIAGELAREFVAPRPSAADSFVLREPLADAVALVKPQAEARGRSLALLVDPRLPHICHGLAHELRQLAVTLLRQALAGAARRDIVLAASLVERGHGAVRVRLAVRQEGEPAAPAPERLAGLFASETDDGAIGRSIAEALAAELGGTIAEPQDGAAMVVVELPFASAEDGVAKPPDLAGRRVMLVTADRALADRLGALFALWHGEIECHADGEDALGGAGQLVVIDGRRDPLAALSLAHRFATAAQRPPILFIAPRQASEAVAGLAASELAAVVEEPVSEAALASGLMSLIASAASEPAADAAAGLRILAADDDAGNREALKSVLERAGHRVELAADGGAALGFLDKGACDVALIDLDMPGVSGDAVAKLHRMRHPASEVPLVALAATAGAETEARCREAGFDAVVTKPVDAAELVRLLAELHGARAARRRASAAPDPAVTPISAHPRFLGEGAETVREATIESLRGLGGAEFLAELVDTFRHDALRIVPRLREAAHGGDIGQFADLAHALRSGAANIGGARLAQTLTALEDLSAVELRQAGAAYVEKIESELQRLDAALEPFARKERRG